MIESALISRVSFKSKAALTSFAYFVWWHRWAKDNMGEFGRPLGCDGLKESFQQLHGGTIALLVEYQNASSRPVLDQWLVGECEVGFTYFSKLSSPNHFAAIAMLSCV